MCFQPTQASESLGGLFQTLIAGLGLPVGLHGDGRLCIANKTPQVRLSLLVGHHTLYLSTASQRKHLAPAQPHKLVSLLLWPLKSPGRPNTIRSTAAPASDTCTVAPKFPYISRAAGGGLRSLAPSTLPFSLGNMKPGGGQESAIVH